MCNVWNTNARCCYTANGNGLLTQVNTNSGCGWNGNGWTVERICRDCNGGLWIRVGHTCSCHQTTCGCCNGNGTTQNTTDNGTTGTGFGCVTFCGGLGNTGTATTTTALNGEAYYARQYGLCGRTRNCCGG